MPAFPSRFRRLDQILADLPIDDPLLLTELDGYLTGIAVCPEAIAMAEWLPPIWGGHHGEDAPFDDPIDVRLFADMVLARLNEILRDLGRGKAQPIFDIDERNGDVLWEEWIGGFAMAMALRPECWTGALAADDTDVARALVGMQTLIDIASGETTLTSMEINAICDDAARLIADHAVRLHALAARKADAPDGRPSRPAKVGRNDPCACGSGKKQKRCCGAA